jgi:hypothetical protein
VSFQQLLGWDLCWWGWHAAVVGSAKLAELLQCLQLLSKGREAACCGQTVKDLKRLGRCGHAVIGLDDESGWAQSALLLQWSRSASANQMQAQASGRCAGE